MESKQRGQPQIFCYIIVYVLTSAIVDEMDLLLDYYRFFICYFNCIKIL